MESSEDGLSSEVRINISHADKDDKGVNVVIVPENILQAITNSSDDGHAIPEGFLPDYKLQSSSQDVSSSEFDVDQNASENLWLLFPPEAYTINSEPVGNIDETVLSESNSDEVTVSCMVVNADQQETNSASSSDINARVDVPLFQNCLLFTTRDSELLPNNHQLPELSSPLKIVHEDVFEPSSKTSEENFSSSLLAQVVDKSSVSQTDQYSLLGSTVCSTPTHSLHEGKSVKTADKATDTDDAKLIHKCSVESCGLVFTSQHQLHKHTATVHEKEKVYKCSYTNCRWSFNTPFKLRRHMNSHYKRKPFVCDYVGCGKAFAYSYNLTAHLKSHSQPRVMCHICSFSAGKRDLEIHMRKVHNEAPSFLCSICKQLFHTLQALTMHKKSHDPHKVEHSCPLCGKTYSKRCELKEHLYMHTGERPYQCDQCEWTFTSNSRLTRHKKLHEKKRYNCSVNDCPKQFHRLDHLAIHLKKSHAEDAEAQGSNFHTLLSMAAGKDAKLHVCDSCNFSCLSPHGLVKHKAVCEEKSKLETDILAQDGFIETSLVDNEVIITSDYDEKSTVDANQQTSVGVNASAKGLDNSSDQVATASEPLPPFVNNISLCSDPRRASFVQTSVPLNTALSISSDDVADQVQPSDMLNSYAAVSTDMTSLAVLGNQTLKSMTANCDGQEHFLFEDETSSVTVPLDSSGQFSSTTINLSDLQ